LDILVKYTIEIKVNVNGRKVKYTYKHGV